MRYSLNKNKYLLEGEYQQLIKTLDSNIDKNPRDCLLIYTAISTGGRATEILNLTREDLNPDGMTVLIHGLKKSDDREIPIVETLYVRIQKYADGVEDRIFPITYNRFHQIWEQYRPVKKTIHCLRHTFAIRLYQKTKDIRLLQAALGHRNIRNTMIYADYAYSQQELRRLIL